MNFISLVEAYGLLVVLAGLLASILCGCVKIPIVKHIKKKNLGEKATTTRIHSICTLLVAVFSVAIIVTWSCVTAGSLKPFSSPQLYSQILLAISFAKIAYMLYEGVGVVSLKKWMHQLYNYLKQRMAEKGEKAETARDYIEELQTALTDTLHMPLTDHQKELLKQTLTHKGKSE